MAFFIILSFLLGQAVLSPNLSSLSAQTTAIETFESYPLSLVGDSYSGEMTAFDQSGVTWTSDRNLRVCRFLFKWSAQGATTYYYTSENKAFLDIASAGGTVYITSSRMHNISDFSMRILRYYQTYSDGDVKLQISATGAEPWTDVAILAPSSFSAYIVNQDMAQTYKDKNYDPKDFTEFSHHFETPVSGYLRLRLECPSTSSPFGAWGTNFWYAIPSISVTYNAPDPMDCSSCFPVVF